ncbi:MAG: DUF4149 domain-containing protein [Nitrospiraceae bacterium]|nr:DUF4149 domain-containing protein [Nitrospiraceae bacterium]
MKTLSGYLYAIALSLWFGGMSVFTLLITPAIFRSYSRDQAGEIVGKLFPLYFPFTLAVCAAALALLLLSGRGSKISLVLVSVAVALSLYVNFRLYPEVEKVKQEVRSFERAPDDPARTRFRSLHAQSAVINLVMIGDGLALLVLLMRKSQGRV